ncbi:MAG: TonB-dependent receptor domain-containing protein [Gemmatimonadales bacterium]
MSRAVRFGAVAGLLVVPTALSAQDTSRPTTGERGRIVGTVVAAEGGVPLAGARVVVVGTTLIATTRVDGRFRLDEVPAGSVTLRVAMIGFAPKTVTGVSVIPGDVTTQDVTLSAQAAQLEEITVTAEAEQGTVAAALTTQRHATAIVSAITAEEIRRSPDGDAATALQRVSGAAVQDGRYVNLRGLGDRYTRASLNGARIPSPEPERKVVPLDLFPTALLSEITTAKTFTPDQAGDASGGAVNIRTREFPGHRHFAVSLSAGFNDAVAGRTARFAPNTSRDWLALGARRRALPGAIAEADFTQQLPPAESNALVNSLRNVWSARERAGSPNGGLGASLAGTVPAGGTAVSYLLSGTYSYAQEIRADEQRALAQPPSTPGAPVTELDRYDGSTGRSTVLWGGLANLSSSLGSRTKIILNTAYNRTMDNEGRWERGTSENLALPLEIQRLRYVERSIGSSQLEVFQELSPQHFLTAGVVASRVTRREPDRSEIVSDLSSGEPSWYGFSNEAAVRTFADLAERSLEGKASWRFQLGAGRARFGEIGVLYRTTSRDATNRAYSVALVRPLSDTDQHLPPEELFDGRLTQGSDANVRIVPLGAGGSYTASDNLAAGYAMLTLDLTPVLELTGGARVERSQVEVSSLSTAGEPSLAAPRYTDVLPSLALTYRAAGGSMNVRLSASQTLSRPEYRELSPILFREVIGGDHIKGNPELQRALVRNLDFRWEWYPRSGEVLSAAVFAKWFRDPIERVYQGTSGERIITYINARGAENVGVELEARRALDLLGEPLRTVTVFANATLMRSRIRLDPDAGSLTNSERKMVGQAPYLLNAGLTWKHPTADASATVLFNRVGERITEAGEIPLPDVMEEPRNLIDASVTLPLIGGLGMRVDARNLLDAPYRLTQGTVIREGYRSGRVFAIGFNWKQ